jgi:hypothetical protein
LTSWKAKILKTFKKTTRWLKSRGKGCVLFAEYSEEKKKKKKKFLWTKNSLKEIIKVNSKTIGTTGQVYAF